MCVQHAPPPPHPTQPKMGTGSKLDPELLLQRTWNEGQEMLPSCIFEKRYYTPPCGVAAGEQKGSLQRENKADIREEHRKEIRDFLGSPKHSHP